MKAVLDHVGIAVGDLSASLAFFRDVLGLHVEATEEIPSQRVRATFLDTGHSTFEMLEATAEQAEQMLSEQQKEYEALLEEKSEVIRKMHQKLQDLKQQAKGEAAAVPIGEDNAQSVRQELMALKADLEAQRRALEEDEEALMQQARQMEMAMSRERVELARQRNEVQQMYRQLQHEIELAMRDGNLRERLINLQRRNQETAAPSPAGPQQAPRRAQPTQKDLSEKPVADKGGGLLGRLFGK